MPGPVSDSYDPEFGQQLTWLTQMLLSWVRRDRLVVLVQVIVFLGSCQKVSCLPLVSIFEMREVSFVENINVGDRTTDHERGFPGIKVVEARKRNSFDGQTWIRKRLMWP